MPYIDRDARADGRRRPEDVGELAYAVAELLEDYRQRKGDAFQTFADVDAGVRAAVREFERKVINPYEDKKAVDNGQVFEDPRSRREREARERRLQIPV